LALISSMARSMPFFQLVPTVAPPPDSSATVRELDRRAGLGEGDARQAGHEREARHD